MYRYFIALLLPLLSGGVFAACGADNTPIFSCVIEGSNKQLEICAVNYEIRYRFGRNIDNPELSFSTSESYYEFVYGPYWINRALFLPRGNTTYAVITRSSTKDEGYHDLLVFINGEQRAELTCLPESINDSLSEQNLMDYSRKADESDPYYNDWY